MRRALLLGLVVLAACSNGAEAGSEAADDCPTGGLGCLLVDEADLATVFGDEVVIDAAASRQLGATVSWCERPLPAPVERVDRAYTVTSPTDAVTVALSASALRFDGADADVAMTVLRDLRQGCSWEEGGAVFRFLDELDVAGFGEDAVGLLLRVEVAGVEDNVEVVVVRQADLLTQVGLFPAQDSPVVWDALARRLDERLEAVAG